MLGAVGFYRVLSWFYRVLSGLRGFYPVLSGFIRFYPVLSGFGGLWWALVGFGGFWWVLVGFSALVLVDVGLPQARLVPETTSLFALLWRTRVIRHAHAASHVPSDTAGEHDTSTPVLVRPRGRAPTSESGVREHTPHFRCSSRTTRTRTKIKNAKMTTKAAWVGRNRLH